MSKKLHNANSVNKVILLINIMCALMIVARQVTVLFAHMMEKLNSVNNVLMDTL